MKPKTLNALSGWVNVKTCERCKCSVARQSVRFHCKTCNVNVCMDCASGGRRAASEEQLGKSLEQPCLLTSRAKQHPESSKSSFVPPKQMKNSGAEPQAADRPNSILASSLVPIETSNTSIAAGRAEKARTSSHLTKNGTETGLQSSASRAASSMRRQSVCTMGDLRQTSSLADDADVRTKGQIVTCQF